MQVLERLWGMENDEKKSVCEVGRAENDLGSRYDVG